MTITRRLVDFTVNTSFDSLPSEVISCSKDMMLNSAAVGLAAAAQPESRAITSFVQEMRGNGLCTVIGMGVRTSPIYASLANGLMVHLLDFDDEVMQRGNHPSSVIFPVAMALGEMRGATGKDVLAAFVVGCEIATKLAALGSEEEGRPGLLAQRGWHPDGVAGTLGAAAAAAKLLGLNSSQTENAFGIAVGEASGVQVNYFSAAEAFQCGRAAMNGIMAAMMSQKGISAAWGAVEARGGLLDCYCTPLNSPLVNREKQDAPFTQRSWADYEASLLNRLGQPYEVLQPGIGLKLYPCETASHTSIDAVLQLAQQHRIEPAQVVSVEVRITPTMAVLMPCSHPETGREARASLNYTIAAALLHGHPLIDNFSDAAVRDPQVQALAARVTVEATETSNRLVTWPSTVAVTLTDGRVLQQRVDFARGQPEFPLTEEELNAKFLYCTRYILPPDHIEGAMDQLRDLERVHDVTALASILGG